MDIAEVFKRTDWPLLAEQKLALLAVIRLADEHGASSHLVAPLDGLLHWIDALQEAAHAAGYPVVWLEAEE